MCADPPFASPWSVPGQRLRSEGVAKCVPAAGASGDLLGPGTAGVVLGDRLELGGEPDVVAVGGGGRVDGESEAAHASTVLPKTVQDKR